MMRDRRNVDGGETRHSLEDKRLEYCDEEIVCDVAAMRSK
jgi:hypothetical protein